MLRLAILSALLLCSMGAQAKDCIPTWPGFAGTHYKENPPNRVNVSSGLTVQGKVLSAVDCQPIANARIEYWQTNTEGFYVDRLRAWFNADDDGNYKYETEWPGATLPHIHFIISAEGYRTITTQWHGDEPVTKIELDFVLIPEK